MEQIGSPQLYIGCLGLRWVRIIVKKSNIKVYIWFVAVITIGLWAIVLWVSGIELKGSVAALKKLPVVITIEAGLWALFTQWMWKWKIFQPWFVLEPIIQGTWKGSLKTTWINPETGESPEPYSSSCFN